MEANIKTSTTKDALCWQSLQKREWLGGPNFPYVLYRETLQNSREVTGTVLWIYSAPVRTLLDIGINKGFAEGLWVPNFQKSWVRLPAFIAFLTTIHFLSSFYLPEFPKSFMLTHSFFSDFPPLQLRSRQLLLFSVYKYWDSHVATCIWELGLYEKQQIPQDSW